jgi:hypothetical protein
MSNGGKKVNKGITNRWLGGGIVWERQGKGVFINLLTWTVDVSYGHFGHHDATFECAVRHIPKVPLLPLNRKEYPLSGDTADRLIRAIFRDEN